tara:strand:- start:2407 stop:2604 length:198 start_codon:yes stop_codon:yes gene_type:complete
MKTKTAVNFVLKHRKDAEGKALTKYRLSSMMGSAPISVDQWLKRTKMGEQYKAIFLKLFGVQIND